MSRPRLLTRDALGERVANSYRGEDIRRALADLPTSEADFILHLVEGMASNQEEFLKPALVAYLNRAVSRLREDPVHEQLLAVYNGRPYKDPQGQCRGCHRPLDARSGPGRPRRHCSNRCRQLVWRNRRRAIDLFALAEEKCHDNNIDPVKNLPILYSWIRTLRKEPR